MTKYLVRCYSSIRTHKQTHRMKQLNLVNCTQEFLHIIFIFRSQFRYNRRAKTEDIFQIKRTHMNMTNERKEKIFVFSSQILLLTLSMWNQYFCLLLSFVMMCALHILFMYLCDQINFSSLFYGSGIQWSERELYATIAERYIMWQSKVEKKGKQSKKILIDNVVKERMFTVSFSLVQL